MDIFDYFEIRRKMDPYYEGKFIVGSYSMGIFCNVTCPRTPPEHPDENDLVVLHNIYEGFSCGLLPCEECEPDMYTDRINLNMPVSPLVQRVVSMIEDGYMNSHTVKELAKQLRVSERYLRKMFVKETGLTPSRLAMYHRGTIAKRLLSETNIPITDIAYISGFGSVRQFNQVMRDMYQTAPTQIRTRNLVKAGESNELYIDVTEDFDFRKCLAFMKRYEIAGLMKITEESYARTFMINGMSGCFEALVAQKQVYLTYYQSYRDFHDAVAKIQGLEEKSVRFIAMHGLGLKDVEYPAWSPETVDRGWEEYCSYTALICNAIRRSQDTDPL